MTIAGLIFPLLHFAVMLYYDVTFTQSLPNWTFLLGAISLFWYQQIDAVDGKQARRTNNCSSLGQLLDHSKPYIFYVVDLDLDQISYTIFFLACCTLLQTGNNLVNIMLMLPATFVNQRQLTLFRLRIIPLSIGSTSQTST